MPAPLKVSDKGSALSCPEHDENVDRYLDRANHTGTQDCNTITNLDGCVSVLPSITGLQGQIDTINGQIANIEAQLAVDGLIDDRIQAVYDDLIQQINTVDSRVTALQAEVDTNETNIAANTANFNALSALVNSINLAYQAADNLLDGRVSVLETTTGNHTTLISTNTANIAQEILDRIAGDNTLQSNINQEELDRIAADGVLQANINQEAIDRANAVTSEENARILADSNLQSNITNEENTRILQDGLLQDGIDDLQDQIDLINTQLAGIQAVPIGSILMSLNGITQPLSITGYILCNGAAVSRTTYSALFAVIGTTFGIGDGASTFNVPNFNDRFPLGTAFASTTGETLGSFAITIPPSALPAHTHSVTDAGHAHWVSHPAHSHLVVDPGHAHGIPNSSHSHGITNNNLMEEGGPSQTKILVADAGDDRFEFYETQAANVNLGGTVGATTGIALGNTQTFGNSDPANTGIVIDNAGSGQSFNTVQPYIKVNYYIKF